MSDRKKLTVGIVGAGASGMISAITAAKNGASVTLFEKNDRVGKKILATGNGKCNFTNKTLDISCYRGENLTTVNQILKQYPSEKIVDFFAREGMLSCDKNGYYYPVSGQSSTVLDILRKGLRNGNVCVKTECEVVGISYEKSGFKVQYTENRQKQELSFDKVIISAGSIAGLNLAKEHRKEKFPGAYQLLKDMHLPMVPLAQALVQIRCRETDFFKSVSGVRLNGNLDLFIDGKKQCSEYGEIQLTNYGLSGIPTFQLSRYVSYALQEHKKARISMDCLPDITDSGLKALMHAREMLKNETAEEYFLGLLNKKLLFAFLGMENIRPGENIEDIPAEKICRVFRLMKNISFEIIGVNPFEQAQVCAGGLAFSAVDQNLQVIKYPGLYVTGEMLDVDGRCGGYNLHWAFSSGICAAKDACKREQE